MYMSEVKPFFEPLLRQIPELGTRIYRAVQLDELDDRGNQALQYPAAVYTVLPGVSEEYFTGGDFRLAVQVSFRGHDQDILDSIVDQAAELFKADGQVVGMSSPVDALFEPNESVLIPARIMDVVVQ